MYSGTIADSKNPDTMDPRAIAFINSLPEADQQAVLSHTLISLTEKWIPVDETVVVSGHAVPAIGEPGQILTTRFVVKKSPIDLTMYIADSKATKTLWMRSKVVYLTLVIGLCVVGSGIWAVLTPPGSGNSADFPAVPIIIAGFLLYFGLSIGLPR